MDPADQDPCTVTSEAGPPAEDLETDMEEGCSEYPSAALIPNAEDGATGDQQKKSPHAPITCRECGQTIYVKPILKEYVRNMNQNFVCDACVSAAAAQPRPPTHAFALAGEKILSCKECCFRCSGKKDLKNHMRIHTREKLYFCTKCSFACSDKLDLKQHAVTHSCQQEKPFSCQECGLRFSMRTYLRTHMRTHTGEKPYSCHKCSFICSQKSSLNRHVLTHSEEKLKRNSFVQSSQKTVFKNLGLKSCSVVHSPPEMQF